MEYSDAGRLPRALLALALVWAGLSSLLPAADAPAPSGKLLVFAAASLTDVLTEISADYTSATGRPVALSFAASSALAKQIEAGAQADVFFSADTDWMDYLEQRKLIASATRTNVLGNRLVLIAPADSALAVKIEPGTALCAALGDGRLATGDPDSVPAGRYARAALTTLGSWGCIADRLVRADNVRAALAFVARGEAPLGIVYRTDALVEKKVRILAVFPAGSHPPITYPAAATASSTGGAGFIAYLKQPAAQAVFRKFGFDPPP